ncbi:MFS transporter [Sphingorhabdus lutea]|uniref:MFS transporter n=1 Tax=Sphingorhabdus lutea TaxID=1913578 RepID=A0A1L3J8Y6_9SPHN|nr:nitrate/nitrite transporter [Sphingorhabdus lutea]APG61571.1 MFS transporter [Sphingorhabdus lutea]
MSGSSFWQVGHKPTLFAAFLYFDIAFMVWVLLGPLAPIIAKDLALSDVEKGLMVAVPTLAGAILRLVNGVLVDRIGPKATGAIGQIIVIAGLMTAYLNGVDSFNGTLALGVILGFAGASFAVALPLASRWYPPEHQGKAMGIAGMGNSGTVFAALFAPILAKLFGWNAVLGLACIPLAIAFVVYLIFAKDSPNQPAPKSFSEYANVLKEGDAWWFILFYGVTFGGFVGLAASLSIWFTDQFGITPVQAGYCTAACVFAGSLVRPIGGAFADRVGGIKTLSYVYALSAILLLIISTGPSNFIVAFALFFTVMAALGMGNGAVFQLVPQRFRNEIGVMTGLVGFGGGIGGFYLASSLGIAKQYMGSPQYGFVIFAAIALIALVGLTSIKKKWRTTWGAAIQGVAI